MKIIRIILSLMLFSLFPSFSRAATLLSPDGNISLNFEISTDVSCNACPTYSISYKNIPVITSSKLGFDLSEKSKIQSGFDLVSEDKSSSDTNWKPVAGERSLIRDHYNELIVHLKQTTSSTTPYTLAIEFRAYDAGIAFRYTISDGPSSEIDITAENTEFRFIKNWNTYQTSTAQGEYEKKPINRIWSDVERPLLVEAGDNLLVAIGEAALVDYARMRLALARPLVVTSKLGGNVKASLPLTTPWRVVMIADSPARLLENNDIFLNLNAPSAIPDTSWIRPGKVLREVTLTTDGGIAAVDFAVKHNMQYILFDAGWYGPERNPLSDAATITVDPARSSGPLDLRAVIDYGNKHGVGTILYVNQIALQQQYKKLFPLYRSWGVAGVKFGFVNVGPQRDTAWLHTAVRKAVENKLLVDIHDEYRPTGYSRTYPNLLTQEGIRGDEERRPNSQTLITLFTRMLAGPADNTICYFDSRVDALASHAYQLAKSVALFSPWQVLYWYDRPANAPRAAGGAGAEKNVILETPELEFFDALPTIWDDSKVLAASIGQYAVIARRSGDLWFIGALNDASPRELSVSLSGLIKPGISYTAFIYSDDPAVTTPTHVRIDRRTVTASDSLVLSLPSNGGQAIRLIPE